MSDDVKMFIQQKGFPFKYLTVGLANNYVEVAYSSFRRYLICRSLEYENQHEKLLGVELNQGKKCYKH